ncbi:hypothetical protein [Sulfuricystis multivorans]|uniref:hypothetical protein n=1 Tax=Sulfuricystis multivorans TaxID=2211108 RepID=UPI000F8372B9|nr:hypothetical protein [Sulfuricystis multivorans]
MNRRLLCLLLLPLIAACAKEPAGYEIDGGNHSLTVERNKPYFWSSGWELDLIVTRYPECQRRYALKKAGEKLRIDLYRTPTGAYILNQGSRWYVAETQTCRMQAFEEEPPEPGELLGSFRVKGGVFRFVPETGDKGSNNGG